MKRLNFETFAACFLIFIGLMCGIISALTTSLPAVTVLFAGAFLAAVLGAFCLVTEPRN